MTLKPRYQSQGAHLSDCRLYRYCLWRTWAWQGPASCVMFIGLNPSRADELVDDLTIKKCVGFAKLWGFGGLCMLNLFAFRATYPVDMIAAVDPVGPRNELVFRHYRQRVGQVIAAWGGPGSEKIRRDLRWDVRVERVLQELACPVYCLGKTQGGDPRHPSRLAYATPLELFHSPA